MDYLFAFIAMCTMSHSPSRTKTLFNLLSSLRVFNKLWILKSKSMGWMMMILFAHKTIETESEIITSLADNICRHIF